MTTRRTVAGVGVALVTTAAVLAGAGNAIAEASESHRPPSTSSAARTPLGLAAGRVLVIAHRGASATAPENTLPAMRAAVAARADLVEFDVQRTSDGHLVVVHDTTFARTTDVAQVFPGRQDDPVGSFSLTQVRRLDAGSWRGPRYAGTRVPTLHALLVMMRPTSSGLLLELKNPALYPGCETQVTRALDKSGFTAAGRVWVHSFDAVSLARFHRLSPSVPVGLITENGRAPSTDSPWLTTVNTTTASVTDARVDTAVAQHLRVLAWPATSGQDERAQIERLVDDGVAGVISDRPALVRRVLAAR